MQYLKDEIRNKILEAALKEFKENGYKGASVRVISKNSGSSTGNIYKYFSSKESLYENLVGPVYKQLMDYIHQFEIVEQNEKTEIIFYQLMDKIMEIFNTNNKELSILLNKSGGSKYENCKKIFVDFITKIVTEAMEYQLSLQHKKLKDNYIIYLLSYNLVENIAIILMERENGAEVRCLIMELVNIMFLDISGKLPSTEL